MFMAIMIFLRIIDYLEKELRHIILLKCLSLDADIIRDYINDPNIGYTKVEKILRCSSCFKISNTKGSWCEGT